MIQLLDLRKSYTSGDFVQKALDGVTLNLRDNEFVAILGPSGSGKTTLLNVIGGLDRADSGDLIINGTSTSHYKDKDWDTYRNHHIGFIFQSYNLIPHQTVLSNVELTLTLAGSSRDERRERATAALKRVGLQDHINKKPGQLSGGQMQRVAIARALVNDPDIVLADEPTGALDTETGIQVMGLLQEVAADRLVIMVTHNSDLACRYATRIVNLADGRIVGDSAPFALTSAAEEPGAPVKADALAAPAALTTGAIAAIPEVADPFLVVDAGARGAAGQAPGPSAAGPSAQDAPALAVSPSELSDQPGHAGSAAAPTTSGSPLTQASSDYDSCANASAPSTTAAQKPRVAMEYGAGASGPASRSHGSKRHVSMSFLTALGLSFNNLMTKKGRTFLTAFAASIGIMGVAAILAVSNGVNNYIDKVQEDVLSSTPLSITKSSFDMTSILTKVADYAQNGGKETVVDDGSIPESNIMSEILTNINSNDLASFKKFIDGGESGIPEHSNAIVYSYGIEPYIYKEDTSDGVKRLNPGTLASLTSSGISSMSVLSSGSSGMGTFQEMLDDQELLESQFDIVAGVLPESYDECILVLNENGGLSDYTLYSIGVLDPDILAQLLSDAFSSEEVDVPDAAVDVSVDEALDLTFKVVPRCTLYSVSSDGKTWIDRADDEDYLKEQVADGIDLKVVGLVKPKATATSTSLSEGIAYRHDLLTHLMDIAADSQIVTQQLDNPDVDVFTGETFEDLHADNGADFDLTSIFTIDEDQLAGAFDVDTESIEKAMAAAVSGAATTRDVDDLSSMLSDVPVPDFSNMELDLSSLGITDLKSYTAEAQEQLAAMMQQSTSQVASEIMSDFTSWIAEQTESGSTYDLSTGEGMQQAVTDYQQTGRADVIVQAAVESMMSQIPSDTVSVQNIQQKISDAVVSAIQDEMTGYLENEFAPYLQGKISDLMKDYVTSLSSSMASALAEAMGSGISFDPDAFANAITVNMDQDELTSILSNLATASQLTYANNLIKLGYADEDDPESINIYAKSFTDKQDVKDIITAYNERMRDEGQDDKTISYSDLMGVLMNSVTNIINMVSLVLIAFVSVSLIVSSIMIGIITYISVLERKKEIGILRAMGASKLNVANVFNAETVIEGLIAGVLAIMVVVIASFPVNRIVLNGWNVENIMALPPSAGVVLVGISVLLTLLAGLFPSMAAAKRDPVEALRSE